MKNLMLTIILLFTFPSYSQKVFETDNKYFAGTSISSNLEGNVFLQYEGQSDWVKLQLIYLTDLQLKEHRLNAKLGVRPIYIRKIDLEFWTFMSYLNMNLSNGWRYNSPFSFEFNWRKNFAVILDTGFKDVNIQVRYRIKLFSKKTWN